MERSSTTAAKEAVQPRLADIAIAPHTPSSSPLDSTARALPLECAYRWERLRGDEIFLTQPIEGVVRNWTWAQAMDEARRMATWLTLQDWPHGSHIVILSRNSAWWILAELAIWMSGHVTVPIYTSLTLESACQLFTHCEPVLCFVGSLDNPALDPETISPGLMSVRFPNCQTASSGPEWQRIIQEQQPLCGNPDRSADELATIIYTSGTTGSPKGAMHRFGAFPYFAKAVTQVTGTNRRHRVLSYLPLAHIAERALTETAAIVTGWRVFFSESTATFFNDLKRARPTIFFSVPRLYAKFQSGVLEKVPQRKLDRLLRIPILRYFVRRRILNQLGLGSVRVAACGSAQLSPEIMLWFRRLGLQLCEGYGTTEAGITHTAPGGKCRPGAVGRSAPGVSTRISSEGEVQVSSPMNMLGYLKDPEATRSAFTADGFLRTGDLGELDGQGWLKIKGRIKEQFKTSKGKYVSPSVIEFMLNANSSVECSLIMGAGLAAPFAVLALSPDAQLACQTEIGRTRLASIFEDLLNATNARLAPHERLQFLVLTAAKWSIENGSLTPTLKLKRTVLEARYAPFVPSWIRQNNRLIWHNEYNEPR